MGSNGAFQEYRRPKEELVKAGPILNNAKASEGMTSLLPPVKKRVDLADAISNIMGTSTIST